MKMSKLTESARGKECQIRIVGVCNGNSETVVLCHLGGGGMGMKRDDMFGAFGCSSCHDAIDGRSKVTGYSTYELYAHHLEGVIRTQEIWLEDSSISHV